MTRLILGAILALGLAASTTADTSAQYWGAAGANYGYGYGYANGYAVDYTSRSWYAGPTVSFGRTSYSPYGSYLEVTSAPATSYSGDSPVMNRWDSPYLMCGWYLSRC